MFLRLRLKKFQSMYDLIINIYQYFYGLVVNFFNSIFLLYYLQKQSFKHFRSHSRMLFTIFIKYKINKSFYKRQLIDLKSLKKSKNSERLFIFGSGGSINEINDEAWKEINKYDSIGFNGTFHLEKVNFTFKILRAGTEDPAIEDDNKIKDEIIYAEYIMNKINKNKFLKKTIFLFSSGLSQHFPNLLIGYKLWNTTNSIYQYHTNKIDYYPQGNSLHRGLIHKNGTLVDALTFGYYMGYKEIILVGIDLYDNQYFWVPKGKTVKFSKQHKREIESDETIRGVKAKDPHNTVNNGIIDLINNWNIYFKKKDITLSVYNPKSLLNKVLPIFKFK